VTSNQERINHSEAKDKTAKDDNQHEIQSGALARWHDELPSNTAANESKGKILVVLSSADKIELANGDMHNTGAYLAEVGEPTKALHDAGYEVVFADPAGKVSAIDKSSELPVWFGFSQKKVDNMLNFVQTLDNWNNPLKLSDVANSDLNQYKAVFIPGGLAPMQDLWKDPNLGKILNFFHNNNKTTAAICHGPVALLSTLQSPEQFVKGVENHDPSVKATGWPYAGYKGTVVSDFSDHLLEPGGIFQKVEGLSSQLKFLPENALRQAGMNLHEKLPQLPNVVEDRELITGQDPGSARQLGKKLVERLDKLK
jgi:putative intracellular protease/amidase